MMPDEEEGEFLQDLEQAVSPAPVADPMQQIETYASAATETALGNASETYQPLAE